MSQHRVIALQHRAVSCVAAQSLQGGRRDDAPGGGRDGAPTNLKRVTRNSGTPALCVSLTMQPPFPLLAPCVQCALGVVSARMASRQPITVRLPLELHAVIEERAEREHRTLANTLVAIVTDALRPPTPRSKNDGTVSGRSHRPESEV